MIQALATVKGVSKYVKILRHFYGKAVMVNVIY